MNQRIRHLIDKVELIDGDLLDQLAGEVRGGADARQLLHGYGAGAGGISGPDDRADIAGVGCLP